jgi:hypothetical protein
LRKALRIAAGFALIVVGAILAVPGIPGPGIPIFLLGLLLLSDHFEWARRLIAWFRTKGATIRGKLTGNKDSAKPDGDDSVN